MCSYFVITFYVRTKFCGANCFNLLINLQLVKMYKFEMKLMQLAPAVKKKKESGHSYFGLSLSISNEKC